ncbi:MAG: cytochrome b N-terminal domain-containing protein [Gracilimonas sp.]|uniref:cytochrome b N-terminal domain-containing protein n=1 Tax=Gracilimonas sp. TaxID=1974203 RepID=UPI0019BBA4FE|nr:cytochrome b N-terminal domain-containing protein [Gracilimonas sp.]MBD3615073.1 cytochrome b N-terminal domain-containing protein [Gracilimonas sp.]
MSSKKDNNLEVNENQWNWQKFKTNVVKASDAGPDSSMRGREILDAVYKWFRKLDGFTHKYIPEPYHPFIQTGAIANFMFAIAVVTGFALLIWYNPSVHEAYDTVAAMADKPYTAELIRSLHRYSSDAFILFVVFHAFKVFFGARFTGSRWLAWVTGIIGFLLIWFDGWLGYWLVWDERGAMIATATAKMVDVLPIFAEPLKASFLTGDSFNSVLFLIVFFMHMLIPIGFGIAIWLHVSRLNKPAFFTNAKFSILLLASLIIVSLIFPADIEGRADLMTAPNNVTGDYFYLLPLILTERLQGGALWLIFLVGFVTISGIPWLMKRRKKDTQPVVDELKCNGCVQCFYDCPYNAITMVPRGKGNMKKSEFVAEIDHSICVSCGICVGSCDPVAIDYPNLSPWEIRRKLDNWLDDDRTLEGQNVAFVCGNSAGSSLTIDSESGLCKEMPGYLVCTLPCAGWIHPTLIERSLKKGADGVLVMGCESDPDFRLGADWMGERIEGDRHPEFRKDRYEVDKVLYLKLDKPEFGKFLNEAQEFGEKKKTEKPKKLNTPFWKQTVIGIIIAGVIAGFTIWPSSYGIPLPDKESELIISFKKEGAPVFSEQQNNENLPKHMQRKNVQQVERRSDVAVKVTGADGKVLFEKYYEPKGIFSRGYSSGLINIPLNPGDHTLTVQFGDVLEDGIDWERSDEQELYIQKGERVVLRFSEQAGYQWYTRDNH